MKNDQNDIAEKKDDYKTFYERFDKCRSSVFTKTPRTAPRWPRSCVGRSSKSGDEQTNLKEYVDCTKKAF
eukprot:10494661-Heterocapsa_arctica.AAC.1